MVFYHDFLSQSLTINKKKKVIHFSTPSTVFTTIKKLVELLLELEFIGKIIVILQLFNILYCHLVYIYITYIVYITPQTDFFGFRLWISALTFKFMKLWIYLFLGVIVNFHLQAFTFHEILQTKGSNLTFYTSCSTFCIAIPFIFI